jgi:hypothetical protein
LNSFLGDDSDRPGARIKTGQPETVIEPFVVVRLTVALPVPKVVVAWFASWTLSPVLETVPFVTLVVILNEAVAGIFKVMLPFVVVITYVPVRDNDVRVDVTLPLVVVAVTLPQEVPQVKSIPPFVSVIVTVEAVTPEAEMAPFVSVIVTLDALTVETFRSPFTVTI